MASQSRDGAARTVTTVVDMSKAFDSVDHGVLLTKLEWYGVDVEWFRSYLSGRTPMLLSPRCLCVWGGAPKVLNHKVQRVLNFSARVIIGGRKYGHITPMLKPLTDYRGANRTPLRW